MMVTVDGRTSAGDGMSTPDLAALMEDLGAVQAIGLDGGGSTTMVVRGCWMDTDIVNTPSDGAERSVGSGLYVL